MCTHFRRFSEPSTTGDCSAGRATLPLNLHMQGHSIQALKASMDAACQHSSAAVTLSSTIDAHLLQAQHTNQEARLQAHWHQRPCCCSRTELHALPLQVEYEGRMAYLRAMDGILREEARLLSNMVRACDRCNVAGYFWQEQIQNTGLIGLCSSVWNAKQN